MNKKNEFVLIGIISLILLSLVAFLGYNQFSKEEESTDKLIASGHPEWPPIMYQQDDKIVGAGPEIVERIFTELGVPVTTNYEGSWDEVQQKAKDGTVDVLVAAYKTAEREEYMDYSIPYTTDPVVLVVKKGKTFPNNSLDELIDKKGVVMIGDSYGQTFDNFIKEKLSVREVSTAKEAFDLLENEEAHYFVYALYSAQNYMFENQVMDNFEIIPNYITSENFYVTISKKSPYNYLMPQVNELLQKYTEDGIIDQIISDKRQALWNLPQTGQ
ncbi:MAG: transporter substrate-binding domain-containing protein [Patescibacteria group bacterium]|jgi:polar amino acid transport system substrate-binding protein